MRTSTLRRITSAAVATAALAGTSLATASPAAASSYHCNTSHKSIDDTAYNGPWADNWDFTTTLCTKRSGSTVYAKISWDGPVYSRADDSGIFDGAYFKVQVKRSVSGTDPVLDSRNFHGLQSRLENSNSKANYNGSYTTGVVSHRVGSSKGLGDGVLRLNWNNDGDGYHTHRFTASDRV